MGFERPGGDNEESESDVDFRARRARENALRKLTSYGADKRIGKELDKVGKRISEEADQALAAEIARIRSEMERAHEALIVLEKYLEREGEGSGQMSIDEFQEYAEENDDEGADELYWYLDWFIEQYPAELKDFRRLEFFREFLERKIGENDRLLNGPDDGSAEPGEGQPEA